MHNLSIDPEAGRLCGTAYQIFQWHRIFAQFSKVDTHSLEKKGNKILKIRCYLQQPIGNYLTQLTR